MSVGATWPTLPARCRGTRLAKLEIPARVRVPNAVGGRCDLTDAVTVAIDAEPSRYLALWFEVGEQREREPTRNVCISIASRPFRVITQTRSSHVVADRRSEE